MNAILPRGGHFASHSTAIEKVMCRARCHENLAATTHHAYTGTQN